MKFQFTFISIIFFFLSGNTICQTYPGTMINISGGTFTMGNNNPPIMFDDQGPEHLVTINDFTLGETEVSNSNYVIFLNDMASLENLMIEEGVPGDWSSDSTEIANGHAWSIMADSTLSGLWSGKVLIKLSDIPGGGQHPLNRCWIELDTTSYIFSVVEGYENWPASWVNWYGAMMYADYYGLSLPTEAEWEYAARAGQQLEYPTNDGNLSYSQANYGTGFGGPSGETYLSPVGELFLPNPFGLYNMTGNVSEWCLDWYDANFYQTCIDNNNNLNPLNDIIPEDVEVKVLRGGSHTYPGSFAMSSHRLDTPPFVTTDHMGFRVALRTQQLDSSIEGRWIIPVVENDPGNTMYEFLDGLRYTYYCSDENGCDSTYWNSLDTNDAIPNPNPYTFSNDTLTIDLFFGNTWQHPISFECDGNVVTIGDTTVIWWSSWWRVGYDISECEGQELALTNTTKYPETFKLSQNYPNPFNPVTSLRYDLPEDGLVNITIYDMMGRRVKTLVNSSQTAGYKSIQWNATNDKNEPVSAGVYFYTIQAGEYRQTKKMILLK